MYKTRKAKIGCRGVCGLLVLLVAPTTAVVAEALAPQPAAATAQAAAQRAIANNPEVQSRWHTFLAAIEEQRVYKSGYYPRVDLQARVGREFDRHPDTRDDNNFSTATLQLTQMLYDGSFTRSLVRQFERAKLVRYYELLDAAESISLEAVRAFEDVRRQRELVRLARDNFQQHREVFNHIESRVRAGVGRAVDLEQIGGRLALAESNLITELSNLHDVSARYIRVVGEKPAEGLLPTPMLDEGIPSNVRDALYAAYQHNPAFHAAIENVNAARSEVRRERSGYHPTIDLRARNTWNRDMEFTQGRDEVAVIELALNWNLYEGGRTGASVRQRAELVNEAHDRRDIVCRNIRQDLAIAWNDVQRIGEQLRYLEAHRNATDRVRTAYRQQFDIGERGLLDLLDIENEYFESSRALANAQHDWSIAYARTQESMGNLMVALGIAKEGVPTLADLDAEPVDIDPQWICPLEAPEMEVVAQAPVPAPQPAPVKVAEVVTLDAVTLFAFDRAELRADVSQVLDNLVQRIRDTEGVVRVEIVGHTDSIGSEAYNQSLSERRAASVRDYLIAKGIDASLIEARGMGESMPVAGNDTQQGRARNRRVEVAIEVRQ